MRLLVVEDEPKLAALLGRGLREEGHAVDVAERGEDALWMARAVTYDAVVLDVMLPGLDGFSVCRELRENEVWTPVLLLTARVPVERPVVIQVGDLGLDPAARRAWRNGKELTLSAKEFALLEVFMRRPGETLSRVQLLDGAWDMGYESKSNLVDVYVRYLREKIDRPFGRHALETVRRVGYRLREDGG